MAAREVQVLVAEQACRCQPLLRRPAVVPMRISRRACGDEEG